MDALHYLAYLLEGVAAVCGFYYFRKQPADKAAGLFAWFLLFTYLVESIGHIPYMIYRNEALYYLKDSFWGQNYWLFNPYLILSFVFYSNYFRMKLKEIRIKKTLKILIVIYFFTAVINLIFSDVYLVTFSSYTYIVGTLLIFLSISFYYYEMIKSERILSISKDLSFYVSIGVLIFHLATTPFFIYFRYFRLSVSPEFVNLYGWVSTLVNIFLYLTFSLTFLYCSGRFQEIRNKFISRH